MKVGSLGFRRGYMAGYLNGHNHGVNGIFAPPELPTYTLQRPVLDPPLYEPPLQIDPPLYEPPFPRLKDPALQIDPPVYAPPFRLKEPPLRIDPPVHEPVVPRIKEPPLLQRSERSLWQTVTEGPTPFGDDSHHDWPFLRPKKKRCTCVGLCTCNW